tara:strand:- start:125 stop:523 length:399 start_codon:yes stop_codon:yes gene_type:complete
MTHDTKIIKLSSGEEVICKVVHNPENDYMSIVQPMKLNSYPKATRNGLEEALSLQRWIHFADADTFDVPKSQVLVLTEASLGLAKFYEYCVRKSKWEEEGVMAPPTDQELSDIETEEEWDEQFGEPDSKLLH